jgi:outer membrane protein assembly factor BamB
MISEQSGRTPGRSPRARIVAVLAAAATFVAVSGCHPASTYGPLETLWSQPTGAVGSRPAVAGGTVYQGDWSGYERAFDETTGAPRWAVSLGTTSSPCVGSIGITSTPTVSGGSLYLGGGDSNFYALGTQLGTTLWTVPTGDNSQAGGHYNWSSPALHNGHAYLGISSLCDLPLVQGKLLKINTVTHQIDGVFKVVPDGAVGGSVWTSPVADAARNTVFITTGNRTSLSHPYAQAIVGLDATTLAVKGSWALPATDTTPDADWGTSPVLMTDASNRALVSAVNKNGILYAFLRDGISQGPVWQRRLAVGGDKPHEGDGSVSTGFFDGTRLYQAAGRTTIGGAEVPGAIRAIDPNDGGVLWERGLPSIIFGAVTSANGMVVVPTVTGGLFVLDGATGSVLYANYVGAVQGHRLFAGGTISGGRLFIGDTAGTMRAFAYPSAPGASTAAAPVSPSASAPISPAAVPPSLPFPSARRRAPAAALPRALAGSGTRRLGSVVVRRPTRVRWTVGGAFRLRADGRVVAAGRHAGHGTVVLAPGLHRGVVLETAGRWSVRTR